MSLQKLDVSNGLVWCFPYEGQVSLQWLVWVCDSVTIFKTSQQLGTRRQEYERASDFIVGHFASLQHKAHVIPGASYCHFWKTKHRTQRDLSCCYGVNCLQWSSQKNLGSTAENTLLSLSSQSLLDVLDTEGQTFTFDFAMCNCTQDLPETSPHSSLLISC